MKWKRYPSYKDSGVEWLGEVPEHWLIIRLKFGSNIAFSNVDKNTVDSELAVRLCNYTDVYYNEYIDNDNNFMTASATQREISNFTLKKHDVLITKDSESRDDIAVSACINKDMGNVLCGYHLALIRPKPETFFGPYLLRAFMASNINVQFQADATGITRYSLSKGVVGGARFPSPPNSEQKTIAAFLDRQTSRIDTLISKKQHQLELLEEKRNALITHAVTKGLDSNVKMKDSGVEWLEEVPEHWNLASVWMLFSLGRGRVISALEISEHPGPYPVYSSQTENEGIFGYLDTYDFEGDYLTWTTDGANAGTVFHRTGKFNCTNVCGTMKAKNMRICYRYYFYVLNIITKGYVRQDINPKLMNDVMASIKVPFMDPYEQQQIANFLDHETSRIDALKENTQQSIEILKEYRSALITAAVTGQIDVREEV
jgi:type I restriction enzyme S subunit